MRILNIAISDIEYNKFGLKSDQLTFTDFIELVSQELTRQNLDKCVALAEKHGLSKMTMDEISDEVKEKRNSVKKNKKYLSEELAGCLICLILKEKLS